MLSGQTFHTDSTENKSWNLPFYQINCIHAFTNMFVIRFFNPHLNDRRRLSSICYYKVKRALGPVPCTVHRVPQAQSWSGVGMRICPIIVIAETNGVVLPDKVTVQNIKLGSKEFVLLVESQQFNARTAWGRKLRVWKVQEWVGSFEFVRLKANWRETFGKTSGGGSNQRSEWRCQIYWDLGTLYSFRHCGELSVWHCMVTYHGPYPAVPELEVHNSIRLADPTWSEPAF